MYYSENVRQSSKSYLPGRGDTVIMKAVHPGFLLGVTRDIMVPTRILLADGNGEQSAPYWVRLVF